MMRHLLVQPVDDVLSILRAFPQSAFRHDVRAGQLGGLFFVVDADDGAVGYVWVGDEEALEFGGGDLLL